MGLTKAILHMLILNMHLQLLYIEVLRFKSTSSKIYHIRTDTKQMLPMVIACASG
ncbi:hypothetical protein GGU45_004303 [Niabella hirudinis]